MDTIIDGENIYPHPINRSGFSIGYWTGLAIKQHQRSIQQIGDNQNDVDDLDIDTMIVTAHNSVES